MAQLAYNSNIDGQQSAADQANHFVTGFTLGLFAGAAAYFFLATKEGRQARILLNEEWQEAKVHLKAKGLIDNDQASLKDLWHQIINGLIGQKKTVVKHEPVVHNHSHSHSSYSHSKTASTPAKFKGV